MSIPSVLYMVWAGLLSRYSDWATGWTVRGSPVRARFSAPVQTGPGAHPVSCTMGTGSFPGLKSGRGMTLTPHPLLVLLSWKGRAIPLLPLGRAASIEPQCLYKGDLYLFYYVSVIIPSVLYEFRESNNTKCLFVLKCGVLELTVREKKKWTWWTIRVSPVTLALMTVMITVEKPKSLRRCVAWTSAKRVWALKPVICS